MFKRLNHIIDQLHEVELVNPKIGLWEAIVVWFFIQRYAKQRKFELYYYIFNNFCDADK